MGTFRGIHRGDVRARLRKWRCSVRYGQGRNGHRGDGRHAPAASDAEHHPGGHGGCFGNLRANRFGHLARINLGSSERRYRILGLHGLRTSRCRNGLRIERACGGYGDRDSGRRRRESHRTAGKALRRHDPHPHLCGSSRPVRAHRCAYPFAANVLVRLVRYLPRREIITPASGSTLRNMAVSMR